MKESCAKTLFVTKLKVQGASTTKEHVHEVLSNLKDCAIKENSSSVVAGDKSISKVDTQSKEIQVTNDDVIPSKAQELLSSSKDS